MADHKAISIHALREEGDLFQRLVFLVDLVISIHALREEGDVYLMLWNEIYPDFYPRPPRGGRRMAVEGFKAVKVFLSTPSARRATAKTEKNISAFVSV